VVLDAGDSEASTRTAADALAELCRIYWRPVYLFLRRHGRTPHDAQDLTQGFFAELIEKRSYAGAEKAKGRFRSFLLGALKHYLADAQDFDRAQKRGGGAFVAPLDEAAILEAEKHVVRSERWNAHRVYDRAWAEALLRQSLQRVAEEYTLAGKEVLFDALRSHLSPEAEETVPYEQLSAQLQRPAATLRKEAQRLRTRYGEILREEIGGTVTDPAEINEELRYLCEALTAV
jgi:RNA polymerase sigma-70 factor (ECF subfamily)